ncbi:hypothetical protein [uncultured Dubosiella sp.]|uniref:hypothetical protein n=1 Tax=uncultured Dubosiella sp. TaxID=1937011 RepID=UPI0025AFA4A3|nr:hypothetical protein [uncultured Dubosiella sp.]
MKKTHLYGAVAATMLLAPVTANVLAEENDSLSEATETQEAEEFSDSVVLPPQDGEGNPADTGTGGEGEVPTIEGEGQPGEGDTDPGTLATPDATDSGTDAGDEASKNEDNSSNGETEKSGIEDEAASYQKDVAKAKEQPIVKAEDIVIPEEPTWDTVVTIIKDKQTQGESKVRDYYLKNIIYAGVTDSDDLWEVVDPFTESMIDWSRPMTSYFGDFSKTIYLNVSEQIKKFNEKYNVNYGSEDGHQVAIGTMEFDAKNKKWILREPSGGNGSDSYKITQVIREQKKETDNSVPSEKDLDSNYIKGEVIKKNPTIQILVDGVEKVVPLTPEMLNISEYSSAKNYKKSIHVNLDFVKKYLNLNPDEYLGVQERAGGQGFNSDKWAYLYTDVRNAANLCRISFVNGKWDFDFNFGDLSGEGRTQIVKKNIPGFQDVQKKLDSLKMHVIDINGDNQIVEMDLIPGSYEYHYDYDQFYVNDVLEHAKKLRLDFYYNPYLEAYNKKLNTQYQLANCEGRANYIEMLLTLLDDGSWGYAMPDSPKELFFFVQKGTTSQKPIHKVDYDQNGITLSGESTYDFEGEKFVAQEVAADSVKNPVISKLENKVVYDLHFEDLKGNEVIHIGNYRIQLPIPQQLKGKNLILYHISDSGVMTEIPFKITSDQKIEFETSMFSLFVIGTVGDAGNQPQVPTDSNPSTNPKPSESSTNIQQVSTSRVIRVEEQPLYGSLKTGIGLSRSDSATSHSADTGVSLNLKATLASFVLSGFGILGILKKRREAK